MACAPSGLDSACFGMSRDPLLLSGPPFTVTMYLDLLDQDGLGVSLTTGTPSHPPF